MLSIPSPSEFDWNGDSDFFRIESNTRTLKKCKDGLANMDNAGVDYDDAIVDALVNKIDQHNFTVLELISFCNGASSPLTVPLRAAYTKKLANCLLTVSR